MRTRGAQVSRSRVEGRLPQRHAVQSRCRGEPIQAVLNMDGRNLRRWSSRTERDGAGHGQCWWSSVDPNRSSEEPGARCVRLFHQVQQPQGADLERNPKVAAKFLWKELERQESIRGTVKKILEQPQRHIFAPARMEAAAPIWLPYGREPDWCSSFHAKRRHFRP